MMTTVTGALLFKDNKILIARRPASGKLPGKWEFPGGKVENGETPEECLAREIKEELGIDVMVGELFGETTYSYPDGDIRLLVYFVFWQKGTMEPAVHDAVAWASPAELDAFDFAPADLPLISILKEIGLPPV